MNCRIMQMTEIVYNREMFNKVMVWPGYRTEDEPEALKRIKEEMGAGFIADSRRGTATLSGHFKYKKNARLAIYIEFKEDGKLGIYFSIRAKTIPTEELGDIAEWVSNAMIVLTKYKLI